MKRWEEIELTHFNVIRKHLRIQTNHDLGRRVKQGRARLKRDGTCAETRLGISEKWTSPFKSAGESVQSTAGSRGVRISGQTMNRPCSDV